jgi:hypothetical protein
MSRWIPRKGELVGVKKLGLKGIVIESRELRHLPLFSGGGGSATVLVEGQQRDYGWSDLYLIPPDDDEDDGPEAA